MFNNTKDYGDLFEVPDFDYSGGSASSGNGSSGSGSTGSGSTGSASSGSRSSGTGMTGNSSTGNAGNGSTGRGSTIDEYEALRERERYRSLRAAANGGNAGNGSNAGGSRNRADSANSYSYSPEPEDDGNGSRKRRKNNKKAKKANAAKAAGVAKAGKVSAGFNKFTRILAFVYLVFLVAFEITLVILDVLPTSTLIALIVVMSLLSAIIFVQLYFKNIKKWAKKLATVMSILLIIIFGAGTVYSATTLAFLNTVSVKNENSVAVTKEPFNVLITGIDTNGTIKEEDGRSDVNMLVTVNPTSGQVLLTSVPRDYEVNIVDEGMTDKLTHTGFYGVDMTISSLEDLFDTTINYYVRVNFTTVVKFVDAIGGIDVVSEVEFDPGEDARNTESIHVGEFHVNKGANHLNGGQALAFARERAAFDLGDNQRVRNQQIAVTAMLEKALSSRTMLLCYNKVLAELKDYVEMSFSSLEIRQLVKYQILKNPSWNIMKNQVSGHDSYSGTYTTGSQEVYVMAQDYSSVQKAQEAIQATLDGQDGAAIQAIINQE